MGFNSGFKGLIKWWHFKSPEEFASKQVSCHWTKFYQANKIISR